MGLGSLKIDEYKQKGPIVCISQKSMYSLLQVL